jgi:hypothetical protein
MKRYVLVKLSLLKIVLIMIYAYKLVTQTMLVCSALGGTFEMTM